MNLANEPVRRYSKEDQTYKVRQKRTLGQRGAIPSKAREIARIRAGGRCERCGWVNGSYDPTGRRMGLQAAHLIRRHHIKVRTESYDIAYLCGPSVNTGTCHWWIDHTTDGREWAKSFREQLKAREKGCET